MTTTGQCPVCEAEQMFAMLCAACCDRLERDLNAVPGLLLELDVTISKMARVGVPGKGGSARERNPIHWAASTVSTDLTNTLTTWAREIAETDVRRGGALTAAQILLDHIDLIRRHEAVGELIDEISDAVSQARRVIDRPAERTYVGPCQGVMRDEFAVEEACAADLYAKPDASHVECLRCELVTDVVAQKAWLLMQAADMLCSVKEASQYVGSVGGIDVTEASIRGLIHRKRIAYRPETTRFRLGDLLTVLAEKAA